MSNRYARQISLEEIGPKGQDLLLASQVTIIGCGGLGAIAATYLAGAGVGKITLVDADIPDVSNLHRQVFYTPEEKNTKAFALANYLKSFNPEIEIKVISEMLTKSNIESTLAQASLVLECTDDILCKYLVNDYCHLHNIPMIYGAIYKFDGYVSCFKNQDSASVHLRDIFPEPELDIATCAEIGVMNTIAGMIGLLQANEALKYLLSLGDSLSGKLLTYNCLSNEQMKLNLSKNWPYNMQEVYNQNDYQRLACSLENELAWEVFLKDANSYTLVSILESFEHEDVTDQCYHQPMSRFNLAQIPQDKPLVFYCLSGKRSATLSQQILDDHPDIEVFSMKGGLNEYHKLKVGN